MWETVKTRAERGENIRQQSLRKNMNAELNLLSSQKVWVETLAVIAADTENLKIGSKKGGKYKALRINLKTVVQ